MPIGSRFTEIRSIDPKVEMTPSDFQVPGWSVSTSTLQDTRSTRSCKLPAPLECEISAPAVLMFHGYTGNAGDWQDKLSYVSQGFSVAALDCRVRWAFRGYRRCVGQYASWSYHQGACRSHQRFSQQLLFRQIFLDTAQLAQIVMEMPDVDPDRVGALAAARWCFNCCMCSTRTQNNGLLLFPILSDYKRVWQIDQAKDAYRETIRIFPLV